MMVPGDNETSFSYFLFDPLLMACKFLSADDCYATLCPISPLAYIPVPSKRMPIPLKLSDLPAAGCLASSSLL